MSPTDNEISVSKAEALAECDEPTDSPHAVRAAVRRRIAALPEVGADLVRERDEARASLDVWQASANSWQAKAIAAAGACDSENARLRSQLAGAEARARQERELANEWLVRKEDAKREVAALRSQLAAAETSGAGYRKEAEEYHAKLSDLRALAARPDAVREAARLRDDLLAGNVGGIDPVLRRLAADQWPLVSDGLRRIFAALDREPAAPVACSRCDHSGPCAKCAPAPPAVNEPWPVAVSTGRSVDFAELRDAIDLERGNWDEDTQASRALDGIAWHVDRLACIASVEQPKPMGPRVALRRKMLESATWHMEQVRDPRVDQERRTMHDRVATGLVSAAARMPGIKPKK